MKLLIAIVTTLLLTACTSLKGGKNGIRVQLSGPPGTKFVCNYQLGALSGSVKSTIPSQGSGVVLDVPVEHGYVDVVKETPNVEVKVTIFEASRERFSMTMPPHQMQRRFTRNEGGWETEPGEK